VGNGEIVKNFCTNNMVTGKILGYIT